MNHSRREVLKVGLASLWGMAHPNALLTPSFASEASGEKLPVAAVVTVYNKNSHADVILGKILEGDQQDGGPGPGVRLVSLYTDQVPANDMSRDKAAKHGFRISPTIDDALTLGTNRIQVAGVLSIGEHGEYPLTPDTQQKRYPRRRFSTRSPARLTDAAL
jgi:hypothetical protein